MAFALTPAKPPYSSLEDGDEWRAFLTKYPGIEAIHVA